MIVRILHEGQYEVSGATLDRVHELDQRLVEQLGAEDEAGFQESLNRLLQQVRQDGKRLPDAEIRESHLILPAADFTLAEARRLFHP